jgi:hypothetical protein
MAFPVSGLGLKFNGAAQPSFWLKTPSRSLSLRRAWFCTVLLALAYNFGPTAACAQDILPYERDYNTYNRFEQLHSKSCGPTCSTMLLDDMGFPTNLEGASRYYAPNKPYYNYNKNILRNYRKMGMTDGELQVLGFKEKYGPEYSGSQPRDLARDLKINGGVDSNLYLLENNPKDALYSIVQPGKSVIVGIAQPGQGIGHAIIVDGVTTVNGKEYYIVRDPSPNSPLGGRYLKSRDSLEAAVRSMVEPLPPGVTPPNSLNPERKAAGGRYRRALPVSDPDITETDVEDITEGDATVGSDRSRQTQGTEKTSSKGTQGSEKTKGSSTPGETEPQPPGVGDIGKEGAKVAGFAIVQALIVCSMQPYDSYGECLKKEGKGLPMAFAIGAVAATGPAAGVAVGGLGIIAFAAQVINTGVEYYKALAANQEWYTALAAQRKNHTDDQEDINEKRRSCDYVGALEIGMARLADLPEDDRPNWIDNSLIALHRQAAEQIAVEGLINEASKQPSGSPQERQILQTALGAAGDEPCLVDKVSEAMNFNPVVAVDGQPVDGGQAPPQAALGVAHADDDQPQTVDDICARLWKFGLPMAPQCFAQGPSDQAPDSSQGVASQNAGQTGSLDTARPAPSGGRRAQSGRCCAGRAPSRDDWCQD